MATYLLKTEPSTYSYDDLVRQKKATWDGVANPAALANLRAMKKGDELLIYHTGDEKAVVGLARAIGEPFEDPKQPGKTADGKPKFAVIDLAPVKAAKTPVTLAAIKEDKRFEGFDLVRLPRLSVMLVPLAMDKAIRAMAGL
jgi:predicted RNA-binding protein with PUA-like domain